MFLNFFRSLAKMFNLIPEVKQTEEPSRQLSSGKDRQKISSYKKKKKKKGKNGQKVSRCIRRKIK